MKSTRALLRQLLPDLGAIVLLWLLISIFFWRLITPDLTQRMYYVGGDFTWKEQAQQIVQARSWAAGHLPLWNPYIYAGQPITADSGEAVFYPLTLLATVTAGAHGVTLLRMEWEVVISFFTASLLIYLWLRVLTQHQLAALAGALLYTFSGYLTSFPPHQLDILETGTWLPLLLLAIRRIALSAHHDAPLRWRWTVIASFATALTMLAGHPQTALLSFEAAIAYYLYLGFRYRAWRHTWLHALVTIVLSTGIATAQLLPSLEFFPHSNRTAIPTAAAAIGLPWKVLPDLVLPHYANEAALYVGWGTLFLALYGALRWWRAEGLFWTGLACAALLLSLGGHSPAFLLFQHLGFGLVRDQSRAVFLSTFAIATLAARGFASAYAHKSGHIALILTAVFATAGPFLVDALARAGDRLAKDHPDGTQFVRLFVMLLLFLSLTRLHQWLPFLTKIKLPLLLLTTLLTFDAMAVNWNNNITPVPQPPSDGLPSTIAYLQSLPKPFRIATDGNSLIPANDLGNYGLETDQGYNDFRTAAIQDLLNSPNQWRVWQILNVKEFLTTRTFGPPFTLQHTEGSVHTYAISGTLPRAWAIWQYRVIPNNAQARAIVLSQSFNPGETVILDHAPALSIPALPQHQQQVIVREINAEQTNVSVTVDQSAILVLSQIAYPGWQVTIDGHSAPILEADGALQAVAIPAGSHLVTFRFTPRSATVGILISVISSGLDAIILSITLPWVALRARLSPVLPLSSSTTH